MGFLYAYGMKFIRISAILGLFGVVFGAFGGHVLKHLLAPPSFDIYSIGVFYHLIHSVALLAFGIMSHLLKSAVEWPGWAFFWGVVLFSGSLYIVAITSIKFFVWITPIGGVLFLVGWVGVGWISFAKKQRVS